DHNGNLHIVGRSKDVIRSGSSTIVPKEVEDAIAQHPAVAEVAVIGLPDAEWGEAVTAFVGIKPGGSVSEPGLVEHCRARLAGYKKPRAVRFVASLPRSHYGKVLRAQLIAQATGEPGAAIGREAPPSRPRPAPPVRRTPAPPGPPSPPRSPPRRRRDCAPCIRRDRPGPSWSPRTRDAAQRCARPVHRAAQRWCGQGRSRCSGIPRPADPQRSPPDR